MEPSVGIMELVLSVGKVVTSPEGGKICYQCHAYDEILPTHRRAKTYRYCHTLSARKIGYPLLAQKKKKKCYRCYAGVM